MRGVTGVRSDSGKWIALDHLFPGGDDGVAR